MKTNVAVDAVCLPTQNIRGIFEQNFSIELLLVIQEVKESPKCAHTLTHCHNVDKLVCIRGLRWKMVLKCENRTGKFFSGFILESFNPFLMYL